MIRLKLLTALTALLLACASAALAGPAPGPAPGLQITTLDPGDHATLGAGDRLYLRILYESPAPVRFVAEGYRQGEGQEIDAASSSPPYDAGRGEALAWIIYNRPARIDEIRVTAYDIAWQPLGTVSTPIVITWERQDSFEAREPAEWVGPLLKHHRRVFDTAYDPQPEKPQPLFDIFFLLSFMAIPGYLMLQFQMLVRYRGRWQWYAAAPLLPVIPMGLYTLFGLGLGTALWVIFLFRYMAIALIYLLLLKAVVWSRERQNPPPVRQYEDDAAGTE